MTIDLNTLISTAILGLTAWTLYTVHNMATKAAAEEEKNKAQDVRIDENRARIIEAEQKIGQLQVDVAGMEGHRQ